MKDNLFAHAFVFFICSQYIFAKEVFANIFFYVMLLPVFIWHFKASLKEILFKNNDVVSNIVLILFGYVILHTILIRPLDWRTIGIIGSTVSNYIFFIAAREYFKACEDRKEFLRLIMIAASVGALFSICDYVFNYNFPVRLKPWSSVNHEITGASVYAIICLISAYIFIENKSVKGKILPAIACCLFLVVILLSQSRGPMLALLCSGLFLGLIYFRVRFIVLMLIKLAFLCATFTFGFEYLPSEVQSLFYQVSRPDSYRLSIFDMALEAIKEKPLLGYGMRAEFSHEKARTPHNLFLGTAFYLGIPALLILLLLCGTGLYKACKSKLPPNLRYLVISMIIFGITASLTDNSRIVRSPTGAWIFFWMPLAFAAATTEKRKEFKKI